MKTHTNVPVYEMDKLYEMQGQIDVLVLCGGSANDLPTQTVDSHNILMLLIVLIHMQRFLNILVM